MELLIRWIISLIVTWSFFGWLAWKALSRVSNEVRIIKIMCEMGRDSGFGSDLGLDLERPHSSRRLRSQFSWTIDHGGDRYHHWDHLGALWGAMLARPLTHMFDGETSLSIGALLCGCDGQAQTRSA